MDLNEWEAIGNVIQAYVVSNNVNGYGKSGGGISRQE